MEILEIFKVILFGIVEGITEWLPISSTGHLILLDELIKLNASKEFMDVFKVVIQLGAIFAVVVIFWNKLCFIENFKIFKTKKEKEDNKKEIEKIKNSKDKNSKNKFKSYNIFNKEFIVDLEKISLWCKILIATLPAAIVGIKYDDLFEQLFYNPTVVALMLIVFGIIFILVENFVKKKEFKVTEVLKITYKDAILIGLFQLIAAIFPGVSRSGATIIGALLIGINRIAASEFTFFLAIPVMFGASLLKIVKFGFNFTISELVYLILGMIVSFVVSILVIKKLLNYIKKYDFKVFGYYRIVLGIIVMLFFMIK